jgi:hypothetical protein
MHVNVHRLVILVTVAVPVVWMPTAISPTRKYFLSSQTFHFFCWFAAAQSVYLFAISIA